MSTWEFDIRVYERWSLFKSRRWVAEVTGAHWGALDVIAAHPSFHGASREEVLDKVRVWSRPQDQRGSVERFVVSEGHATPVVQ